jgi:hypothetical protein
MQVRLSAILISAALLASCTGQGSPSQQPTPGEDAKSPESQGTLPVTDYSSLADALEAAGFSVRLQQGDRRAIPGRFLGVRGKQVFVDGNEVSAFEFPTERALIKLMRGITPRGDQIPTPDGGTVFIQWAPPRFYGAGRLMVLYFGERQRIATALDHLLGLPFAGT